MRLFPKLDGVLDYRDALLFLIFDAQTFDPEAETDNPFRRRATSADESRLRPGESDSPSLRPGG